MVHKEYYLLLRLFAPELSQKLHVVLLVEGALLNHIALQSLLHTDTSNYSLSSESMPEIFNFDAPVSRSPAPEQHSVRRKYSLIHEDDLCAT